MSIITLNQTKVFEKNKAEKLAKIKLILTETDYKCWKHADGDMTDEEYAPTKTMRANLREAYNTAEAATTQTELDAVVIENGNS